MLLHSIFTAVFLALAALLGQNERPIDRTALAPQPASTGGAVQSASKDAEPEQKDVQPDAPPTADELLSMLEEADADLQTLTAEMMYLKSDALVGEEQRRRGNLFFRVKQTSPDDNEAESRRQFAIEFDTRWLDDRKEEDVRSFIFDGRWLVEKLPQEKQFFKREMVAPGETFDPLAIGEGPFPIPIGQKRAEILKHYRAEMIPRGEGSLEQYSYHLRLHRLPGAEDKLDIEQLDLWYLRSNLLPVRAETIDEGGNFTQIQLAQIKRNTELSDEHFDTEAPTQGWDVEITRWQDR